MIAVMETPDVAVGAVDPSKRAGGYCDLVQLEGRC